MTELDDLPEVTRFVVKVPLQYTLPQSELRRHLAASFPGQAFIFERHEDATAKRISLLPVMEDSLGRARICRPPGRSLMSHIHAALNDFFLGT